MEIVLASQAKEDLDYWKKTENNKILKRIRILLESIQNDPYRGVGKPEGLKYNLSGKWSRRINKEHRLIYKVEDQTIYIYSTIGHY